MKFASGDTEIGGDITLCATVEGLSLDTLWVLDLAPPGLCSMGDMSGED